LWRFSAAQGLKRVDCPLFYTTTMKKYSITLQGLTPYMQHRMDDQKLEDWEKNRKGIIERPDISQSDSLRAEFHCYRNSDGQCFIPAEHFRQSFINAGAFVKSKVGNARKSMKNVVAAMFMVSPEEIILPNYDAIDKRSGVNRNVKARIIVIRPKWNNWKITFTLLVDNDTITESTITEIINYSGSYVGIGSYRPTNNGYFGRFELTELKELKK
jgi:hypothetical protein